MIDLKFGRKVLLFKIYIYIRKFLITYTNLLHKFVTYFTCFPNVVEDFWCVRDVVFGLKFTEQYVYRGVNAIYWHLRHLRHLNEAYSKMPYIILYKYRSIWFRNVKFVQSLIKYSTKISLQALNNINLSYFIINLMSIPMKLILRKLNKISLISI